MATNVQKLRVKVLADTSGFKNLKRVGVAAMAAIAVAVTAAVKTMAQFEKAVSKLGAISGATAKGMDQLRAKARELGRTTAYTATEVVGLQVELAKLGFTTNEIINSSGGVLDLAASLGVDLSEAASLTGTTLRAFGIDTKDTSRVVDVLASAAVSSALDFEKLKESMKNVAPVAAQLGYSLEDTTALLATLADAGISGSRAGTSLRQILLELTKQGLTLEEAFTKLNNSQNKTITGLDLVKKRALPAFLVLADGAKKTGELTTAFEGANGQAENMRKQMEDNLIGDWKKFKSAVDDLGISMGQTVDGPLRDFVTWLTAIVGEYGIPLINKLLKGLSIFALSVAKDFAHLALYAEGAWIAIQTTFGGGASIESLLRYAEWEAAIDKLKAKIDELKDPATKIVKGGPVSTPDEGGPKGTPIDLNEVVVGAPSLSEWEKFVRRFKSEIAGFGEFIRKALETDVTALFVDAFSAIGNALVQGGNVFKAAGNAILNTVGEFLKKLGAEAVRLAVLSIGFAKAVAAIKKWIIANPGAAIAASLALIAIGSAFTAAANSSQSNIGGSPGGYASAGGSSYSSPAPQIVQGSNGTNFTIGEIRFRGQDIITTIEAGNRIRSNKT